MRDRSTIRTVVTTTSTLGRLGRRVGLERLTLRTVSDPTVEPPRLSALTPQWLTGALSARVPKARVKSLTLENPSRGTSERARIRPAYDDCGDRTDLPETLFAKTTPTVASRFLNGATGTSQAEALFYSEIRPLLQLETPLGYYSAVDPDSLASIHLLEDVSRTQRATFCSAADTRLTKEQARAAVTTLAQLHSFGMNRPDALHALRGYRGFWEGGLRIGPLKGPSAAGLRLAEDVIPEALRRRSEEMWPAFVASVELHDTLPQTVLHGDPHLGNWPPVRTPWACVTGSV
jgi:hypothetical protein